MSDEAGPFRHGSRLRAVKYELVSDHEPVRCRDQVDAVSMSVRLEFAERGQVTLRWLMHEEVQSLAVGPREAGEPMPLSRWYDASDRWPDQVGAALTEVGWAHQLAAGRDEPVPWACRMSFATGACLVVALGECGGSDPTYLPDSLVVIGQRDVARRYRPRDTLQSAWAE